MSTQALEQFTEIMADPLTVLDRMVAANEPETEFLEFKGGRIAKSTEQAKAYFSEVLSAFANTSGGVLIFGIDARQNSVTKVDGACGKVHVPDVEEFRNQLWSRRLQATADAIVGLRIEAVKENGNEGYVVCYVPEGILKPYRAEFADSRYFMRNGDSNTVIPHAVLRSMFYPRSHPKLSCQWWYSMDYDDFRRFGITLTNTGTATAEDLYIKCGVSNTHDVQFSAVEPLKLHEGALTSLRGVHPGERLELIANSIKTPIRGCVIELVIYCKDTLPTKQRLVIPEHLRFFKTTNFIDFVEVSVDDD